MPSDTIGAYRLQGRIGAGGMGQVYRAYDDRLERWVAIKVIRPEALESPEARQRLRREARAVAALSHPAIVQIHDILERAEGDSIVMELVPGETLATRLKNGPLALASALRLAREIAEGLEEAHGHGFIHRDLKAENVMVTPKGHAKILDFGLAKRLAPLGGDSTLGTGNRILGTCHAMSPEQAQGFEVDHRSDLFALGSLLYELATGRNPFRRPNAVETLTRVSTHRQPPAREVNPQVPEAVSLLIDQLLEKDPIHRPASAASVAAALADLAAVAPPPPLPERARQDQETVLEAPTLESARPAASDPLDGPGAGRPRLRSVAVGGAALALLAVAVATTVLVLQPAPLYVAVLEPELRTSDGDAQEPELAVPVVRLALVRGLLSFEGVLAVALDEVDAASGTSRQVAQAVAADEAIHARLDCTAPLSCQVALSRVRAEDGSVPWAHSFQVPRRDFFELTTSIVGHLQGAYSRPLRARALDLQILSEDYEEYARLRQAFGARTGDTASLRRLLERLAAFEETSPRFLEAYLLEARVAHGLYMESQSETDLERALAAVAQARKLAPEDPRAAFEWFNLALDSRRLDHAQEALEELTLLVPGHGRVTASRALLLGHRGQTQEALGLMRSAARRHPSSANLGDLAQMEIELGEAKAARRNIEELLAHSPNNFRGRSLLARLEADYGSLERAVEIYEQLVQESPSGGPEVNNLAVCYFLLGQYKEAVEKFQEVHNRAPNAPRPALNLAHAKLALGSDAPARELYQQVVELIEKDPGASDWRSQLLKALALVHLGERDTEAVTAAQDALRLAPGTTQAALEAAGVYARVGDRTSALANVQRAVENGLSPKWLALPWFDSLRSDQEFQALLEQARVATQ